jgi:hypothetical protein
MTTGAGNLRLLIDLFKEMRRAFNPSRSARAVALRKEATLVQGFGILVVIAGIAALSAILLLELWRGRDQRTKSLTESDLLGSGLCPCNFTRCLRISGELPTVSERF